MDHGIPTGTSSFERVWDSARRWIFMSWTRTRGNGYSRKINQLLAHAFAYGIKKKKEIYAHLYTRLYRIRLADTSRP